MNNNIEAKWKYTHNPLDFFFYDNKLYVPQGNDENHFELFECDNTRNKITDTSIKEYYFVPAFYVNNKDDIGKYIHFIKNENELRILFNVLLNKKKIGILFQHKNSIKGVYTILMSDTL